MPCGVEPLLAISCLCSCSSFPVFSPLKICATHLGTDFVDFIFLDPLSAKATIPLDLFRKQPSGQQSFALNKTSDGSPKPGPGLGSISAEVLLCLGGFRVDLLLQEVLVDAYLVLCSLWLS